MGEQKPREASKKCWPPSFFGDKMSVTLENIISGRGPEARVPGRGPGERGFESLRPDQDSSQSSDKSDRGDQYGI